jgi:anti-anti-sigma regulatory factor
MAAMTEVRHDLPVKLDLTVAASLAEKLRELADNDLVLDAAQTTFVGTPGLQVLVSAQKTWNAAGRSLRIENSDEGFDAQLAQFGLSTADLSAPSPTDSDIVE